MAVAKKIKIYQHDLKPDVTVRLERQPDPALDVWVPVDVSDADAIRAIGMFTPTGSTEAAVKTIDRNVTGGVDGMVGMLWEPGDTDEVGSLKFEFEVMWPGLKPETFRPTDYFTIVPDFA